MERSRWHGISLCPVAGFAFILTMTDHTLATVKPSLDPMSPQAEKGGMTARLFRPMTGETGLLLMAEHTGFVILKLHIPAMSIFPAPIMAGRLGENR